MQLGISIICTLRKRFWGYQNCEFQFDLNDGDVAFSVASFMQYISKIWSNFELVRRSRHQMNEVE